MIHTVLVLISCGCKNVTERLEVIVRKAGWLHRFSGRKNAWSLWIRFLRRWKQWAKAMEHYSRVRPARADGKVFLRVETKRKEGGKFEGLAFATER
jgi:hypothetical protein